MKSYAKRSTHIWLRRFNQTSFKINFAQKTRLANRRTIESCSSSSLPYQQKLSSLPWRLPENWRCNDRNDNPITPWPFSPFSLSLSAYISRLRNIQRKLVFTRVLARSQSSQREKARERESGSCSYQTVVDSPRNLRDLEIKENTRRPRPRISRLIKELFRVYPYFDRNRKQTSSSVVPSSYGTLSGDFSRRFVLFSLPFLVSPFRSTLRRVRFSFYAAVVSTGRAGSKAIFRLVDTGAIVREEGTTNVETKMKSPVGLQDTVTDPARLKLSSRWNPLIPAFLKTRQGWFSPLDPRTTLLESTRAGGDRSCLVVKTKCSL